MKPITTKEIIANLGELARIGNTKELIELHDELWIPANEVEKVIDENFSNIGHNCFGECNKCTRCILKAKMGLK